ncbi:thermonuclease family protein [Candidatus Saccharibacteria bacterium]|nr:thermonuclease family protein [Candidatus Saccharibacteria bacterium]
MYRKSSDGIVAFLTVIGILIAVFSLVRVNNVTFGANNTYQTNSTKQENAHADEMNSSAQSGDESKNRPTETIKLSDTEKLDNNFYKVESVVDGDTIKITYNGSLTSVRIIGVNTPETVDPRTTVECFGTEASEYLKQKLDGKSIRIATDSTQADRDKYNRLLRYVYLDGEDVGLSIIANGYGYEYTYNIPYAHQSDYKKAQVDAENQNKGLWAPEACNETGSINNNDISPSMTQSTQNQSDCNIKGNISWSGEKIYHMPGQQYYESTIIDTAYGERWFCSEAEAQSAGWRKSKV